MKSGKNKFLFQISMSKFGYSCEGQNTFTRTKKSIKISLQKKLTGFTICIRFVKLNLHM